MLLCLLYRLPSSPLSEYFDKVTNILENLDSAYFLNFILLDDFNITFCKFDLQQNATNLYPALSNLLTFKFLLDTNDDRTHLFWYKWKGNLD